MTTTQVPQTRLKVAAARAAALKNQLKGAGNITDAAGINRRLNTQDREIQRLSNIVAQFDGGNMPKPVLDDIEARLSTLEAGQQVITDDLQGQITALRTELADVRGTADEAYTLAEEANDRLDGTTVKSTGQITEDINWAVVAIVAAIFGAAAALLCAVVFKGEDWENNFRTIIAFIVVATFAGGLYGTGQSKLTLAITSRLNTPGRANANQAEPAAAPAAANPDPTQVQPVPVGNVPPATPANNPGTAAQN